MYWKSKLFFFSFLIVAVITAFNGLAAQESQELETILLGLLPQKGELDDWHLTFEPRFFARDNLFEYIDGAADQYLLYGFLRVITLDYVVGPDSSSVNVEVYCMKSPIHAFGIYAAERSPDEQAIAIGMQGYQGVNVLNFYKGPYYVKMTSFALSKNLSTSLGQMGRFIAGKIQGEYKEPELFSYFPSENRMKLSERFIPTSFLGQSYLQNGYRCDYATDQETYQIFLVPFESNEAALAALNKYQFFLESQQYKVARQQNGDTVIAEKNQYILAFSFRSYLAGILNIKNLQQGQSALEMMKKNLHNQ